MAEQFPEFIPPLVPVNCSPRRCQVGRDQASHRFLIQRNGAFGDILMGTVILPALREAYPNAHLTWVAEHSERAAIEANPYIDEILVWNGSYWKRMVRRLRYGPWVGAMARLRRILRQNRYDVFVSFQPEEWPLLALGSGASVRVGIFDTFRRFYGARKTSSYTRLYHHNYAHPNLPDHRIDQYLLTLDALNVPRPTEARMSFGYTESQQETADRFLREHRIAGTRFAVLVPQTTWPTKCWPAERFIGLADALHRAGLRVVLSGSPKEAESIRALAAQMAFEPTVLAGQMTFAEFGALLDRAALLVSGDTGPMHLAAALQTPYVALFGPTSPRWYGPRTGPGLVLLHPVPCGPCDQKICPNQGEAHMQCMRLLTLDEVTQACLKVLEETAPQRVDAR